LFLVEHHFNSSEVPSAAVSICRLICSPLWLVVQPTFDQPRSANAGAGTEGLDRHDRWLALVFQMAQMEHLPTGRLLLRALRH
jgi:hypothetical protein